MDTLAAPAGEHALADPLLRRLTCLGVAVAAGLTGQNRWTVNVYLVRIVSRAGDPGPPTPEGRHRDGHDFVGMHVLRRYCGGGESAVYRDETEIMRLTLTEPLDGLMVDDGAVTHEVTPIEAPPPVMASAMCS